MLKLTVYCSTEMMEIRSQWENIFKVLKEKYQPIILYSVKIFFKTEGQVKMFLDKKKKNLHY